MENYHLKYEKTIMAQKNTFEQVVKEMKEAIYLKMDLNHLILEQTLNAQKQVLQQDIKDIKDSIQLLLDQRPNIDLNTKTTLIEQDVKDIKEILDTKIEQQMTSFENSFLQNIKVLLNKKVQQSNLPASCAELGSYLDKGINGIHELYLPNSRLQPFEAYCLEDPDKGPSWTVIQRRQNGSEDFYNSWNSYKNGFGNLQSEFFIGLEKLYAMTNSRQNELWIQLEDFAGEKRFAKDDSFAIGNESEKYALNILGNYVGNAGDALDNNRGQKFSTKDSDNDISNRHCAMVFRGAWWYKDCVESNLNALYLRGEHSLPVHRGVEWLTWHKDLYSLKYVHMAIRPKN